MQQLVFGLCFRGETRRIGIDENVLTMTTKATGCTFRTRITADGVAGSLLSDFGAAAIFESELVFTGETTFQQAGTIAFGSDRHQFSISTVGSGHIGRAPTTGDRYGAAILRIGGGTGQFAGARGLIASTFVVNGTDEIADHHLGVIFIP